MGRKTSPDQWKNKGIHPLSTIEGFAVTETVRSSAKNPLRDPNLAAITRTHMVNKFGKRAFEEYAWE
jgi:hypothetical protein